MGSALRITRTEHTSGALRALASKCCDGAQVRRLLVLAMVLDGHPRSEAASSNGMDRQTLREWVHRYNAAGVAGLKTRPVPGRAPFLTEQRMAERYELVITGPDLAADKVVR
ncbi:MAG: transposase of ISAli3, family [Rhodopila sp.]|nr:transposase of ISAli3, family [Rhodopila sp.]